MNMPWLGILARPSARYLSTGIAPLLPRVTPIVGNYNLSDLFDLIVVENMNNLLQRQQHQQRVMTTSFRTSSNGSGGRGGEEELEDRQTDHWGDCLALLANMCCRLSRLNLLNEPQTLRQTAQATATGTMEKG